MNIRKCLPTIFWTVLILALPAAVFCYMTGKSSQLAEQIKAAADRLDQLHQRQDDFGSALQQFLKSSDMLSATLTHKDEEIRVALTGQLGDHEKAMDENQRKLDQLEQMLLDLEESLQGQNEIRKKEFSQIWSALENSSVQTDEIEATMVDLTRRLQSLREEMKDRFSQFEVRERERHKRVDQEWEQSQGEIHQLQTELMTDFNMLQNRFAQLAGSVAELDRRLRRLETSVAQSQR